MYTRSLFQGLGEAVFNSRYRRNDETWGDACSRVAQGNCSLHETGKKDQLNMEKLMRKGIMLMSGRHLQHGDSTQPTKNQEVFTNCSTASTSHMLFYLLICGSGVGRYYSDQILSGFEWKDAPTIHTHLSIDHPDYEDGCDTDSLPPFESETFVIDDTREAWAKAIERLEVLSHQKAGKDYHITFDFSKIRCKGTPIKGMQNKPAPGPIEFMKSMREIGEIVRMDIENWEMALRIDHCLGRATLTGGVRRSARWAGKYWKDEGIFKFANIKKDAGLYTANNSVCVDKEFYDALDNESHKHHEWASKLAQVIAESGYYDRTGEPGIVNIDKLEVKGEFNGLMKMGSDKYAYDRESEKMLEDIYKAYKNDPYHHIVNPCSEISLNMNGGFCVVMDNALCFADDINEAEQAVRMSARAGMRVNLMDSVYSDEVTRTNRIGVGLCGVHEWAWKQYRYTFHDLLDEEKSQDFWLDLRKSKNAVDDECIKYATEIGAAVPHTNTCVKPGGSVPKLFGVTEGVGLPDQKFYLRYVQYRSDDPKIGEFQRAGYPIKELKSYPNQVVVGFPTEPYISSVMPEDKIVTASDVSLDDHYKWVKLIEKYWIDSDHNTGNQVSYTAKYNPDDISYGEFYNAIFTHQEDVKCMSTMPTIDTTAYEYQPVQPISYFEYKQLLNNIKKIEEAVDEEHLQCSGGACPI